MPAHQLLKELLDAGCCTLYRDAAHAAHHLGCHPVASPLADVVKVKDDGRVKHRLIQDLKASRVNEASEVPERQVLPRFTDHGRDLHLASQSQFESDVLILDFKNAFMTIPLAEEERPFNCTVIPAGIRRNRAQHYMNEPVVGTFVCWRVLGFGGHANPLIYGRVATVAARSGQALLLESPDTSCVAQARLQLYVDDPIVVVTGSKVQRREAVDVLLLWWLILGIPLSWTKGSYVSARTPHTWIGVAFQVVGYGAVDMTLPKAFVEDILQILVQFTTGRGSANVALARSLCGKAARMAQIITATQPYASNLYAAFKHATSEAALIAREAPPGKVAIRRFTAAARWLCSLLTTGQGPVPQLRSMIRLNAPEPDPSSQRVHFDASLWGGGAVLYENDVPTSYMAVTWDTDDLWPNHNVAVGDPRHQTLWEFMMLFLVIERWCCAGLNLVILGDNTGQCLRCGASSTTLRVPSPVRSSSSGPHLLKTNQQTNLYAVIRKSSRTVKHSKVVCSVRWTRKAQAHCFASRLSFLGVYANAGWRMLWGTSLQSTTPWPMTSADSTLRMLTSSHRSFAVVSGISQCPSETFGY